MSAYIYSAYQIATSWFRPSVSATPTKPQVTIQLIAQESLKFNDMNQAIEVASDSHEMLAKLDVLYHNVKLPLELAIEKLSASHIPLPTSVSVYNTLQRFRKDPDCFKYFLRISPWDEKQYAQYFAEFYYAVTALEKHYATPQGKKDFDTHMREVFSVNALIHLMLCDGLHDYKSEIAPIALERLLKLNAGKFPLKDFAETLKLDVFFLRADMLEQLLKYSPNTSKDTIATLYTYEHPGVSLKRNQLPQLTPEEHTQYKYAALKQCTNEMLSFWFEEGDDYGARQHMTEFSREAEAAYPNLRGLSEKIASLPHSKG